ncbi:MAG: sensor histidine kinase [Gammaproteobacteria bacterium]
MVTATKPEGLAGGREVIAPDKLSGMILAATAPLTGMDFFRGLAERLAKTLDVHSVLISECLARPEYHVRTLAYWEGNGFVEDLQFDLRGTPCEEVISDGQYCFHPAGMPRLFPEWSREEGGVESFVGAPLRSSDGSKIVGHIALFDHRPMHESILVEPVFRVFAMRAAAELERLQAEYAAREHLRQLAHVSRQRSVGELTGAMIHEVSQPLTALAVYARTLCTRLEGADARVCSLAHKLEQESERASELVTRLRHYLGHHEIKPQPVRLSELVSPVIQLVQQECRDADIAIDFEPCGESLTVQADPILVQQVIMNLVRNSLDALHARATEGPGCIRLWAEAGDARVNLFVSDTGCGVPEDIRARLFSVLTSSKETGMGVGLALSRSIALEHGGDLLLVSAGKPTTFCLRLPLRQRD